VRAKVDLTKLRAAMKSVNQSKVANCLSFKNSIISIQLSRPDVSRGRLSLSLTQMHALI
jgi:hypothetical protein